MADKAIDIKAIMDAQRHIEEDRKSGKERKVKPLNTPKYRKLVEEANARIERGKQIEAEAWIHARNYVARSSEVQTTKEFTSGDVRLGMGLVRDEKEQEEYVQKSLKKRLP